MEPFDRPYDLLLSATVSISLFCTIFELIAVEISVRCQSRSFQLVPFENSSAVSYLPSAVTMALSRIISEIKQDNGSVVKKTARNFCQEGLLCTNQIARQQ